MNIAHRYTWKNSQAPARSRSKQKKSPEKIMSISPNQSQKKSLQIQNSGQRNDKLTSDRINSPLDKSTSFLNSTSPFHKSKDKSNNFIKEQSDHQNEIPFESKNIVNLQSYALEKNEQLAELQNILTQKDFALINSQSELKKIETQYRILIGQQAKLIENFKLQMQQKDQENQVTAKEIGLIEKIFEESKFHFQKDFSISQKVANIASEFIRLFEQNSKLKSIFPGRQKEVTSQLISHFYQLFTFLLFEDITQLSFALDNLLQCLAILTDDPLNASKTKKMILEFISKGTNFQKLVVFRIERVSHQQLIFVKEHQSKTLEQQLKTNGENVSPSQQMLDEELEILQFIEDKLLTKKQFSSRDLSSSARVRTEESRSITGQKRDNCQDDDQDELLIANQLIEIQQKQNELLKQLLEAQRINEELLNEIAQITKEKEQFISLQDKLNEMHFMQVDKLQNSIEQLQQSCKLQETVQIQSERVYQKEVNLNGEIEELERQNKNSEKQIKELKQQIIQIEDNLKRIENQLKEVSQKKILMEENLKSQLQILNEEKQVDLIKYQNMEILLNNKTKENEEYKRQNIQLHESQSKMNYEFEQFKRQYNEIKEQSEQSILDQQEQTKNKDVEIASLQEELQTINDHVQLQVMQNEQLSEIIDLQQQEKSKEVEVLSKEIKELKSKLLEQKKIIELQEDEINEFKTKKPESEEQKISSPAIERNQGELKQSSKRGPHFHNIVQQVVKLQDDARLDLFAKKKIEDLEQQNQTMKEKLSKLQNVGSKLQQQFWDLQIDGKTKGISSLVIYDLLYQSTRSTINGFFISTRKKYPLTISKSLFSLIKRMSCQNLFSMASIAQTIKFNITNNLSNRNKKDQKEQIKPFLLFSTILSYFGSQLINQINKFDEEKYARNEFWIQYCLKQAGVFLIPLGRFGLEELQLVNYLCYLHQSHQHVTLIVLLLKIKKQTKSEAKMMNLIKARLQFTIVNLDDDITHLKRMMITMNQEEHHPAQLLQMIEKIILKQQKQQTAQFDFVTQFRQYILECHDEFFFVEKDKQRDPDFDTEPSQDGNGFSLKLLVSQDQQSKKIKLKQNRSNQFFINSNTALKMKDGEKFVELEIETTDQIENVQIEVINLDQRGAKIKIFIKQAGLEIIQQCLIVMIPNVILEQVNNEVLFKANKSNIRIEKGEIQKN